MNEEPLETYREFWPFYLREHSRPETRRLHALGTLVSVGAALILLAVNRPIYLPLVLIPGYGFAWYSHFFIEKNRPATFKHPFWSFISDFRMLFLMLSGRL